MYWGDMGVDCWDGEMWKGEMEKHEVTVFEFLSQLIVYLFVSYMKYEIFFICLVSITVITIGNAFECYRYLS
jgi:hypothetical protein